MVGADRTEEGGVVDVPPTNQASPAFSSGKIINLYAALLHEPACRTKTRERRGKTAEPTQKINPARYRLTCSGNISEQKLHKSVVPAAAKYRVLSSCEC